MIFATLALGALPPACGDDDARGGGDDEVGETGPWEGGGDDEAEEGPDEELGPSGPGCDAFGALGSPLVHRSEPEALPQVGSPTPVYPIPPSSAAKVEFRSTLIAEQAVLTTGRNLAVSWCAANIEPNPRLPGGKIHAERDAENLANYELFVEELERATREWERHSRMNFVHRVDLDDRRKPSGGKCDTSLEEVWFRAETARCMDEIQGQTNAGGLNEFDPDAASPDNPEGYDRYLCIRRQFFGGLNAPKKIGELANHESGHIVGLEHEHLRWDQSDSLHGNCKELLSEDAAPLSPRDPASIMGYGECIGSEDVSSISPRDRLGAYHAFNWGNRRVHALAPATGGFGSHAWAGVEQAGLLWYRPFQAALLEWRFAVTSGQPLSFTAIDRCLSGEACAVMDQAGRWRPIVGQFTGSNETLDVLLHAPGPFADALLVNTGTSFNYVPVDVPDRAVAVVGNFGSGIRDQVLWYRPGGDSDPMWIFAEDGSHTIEIFDQDGWMIPITGHFRSLTTAPADIFFFDPHDADHEIWQFGLNFALTRNPGNSEHLGVTSDAEAVPLLGNFNGDSRSDLFWYRPGPSSDRLWLSISNPAVVLFQSQTFAVDGEYRPFVGDFDGDGTDDIFWYRPASERAGGPSRIWFFEPEASTAVASFRVEQDYTPFVEDFDADGCSDILWIDTTRPMGQSFFWRCIPGARNFACEGPIDVPENAYPVGLGGSY
ncbi:MAG: hypothetical protein HC927_02230 [Deltaproteobacteria bacterium]|nr:hypothetical protein [Deltaproteobacteria bacterium]